MYIGVNQIITISEVIGGLALIWGVIFSVYRWYLKQNRYAKEIERIKNEQCLLTYGILACLKGLKENGCNGPVTEAITKIEKHLNQQAHDQEDG